MASPPRSNSEILGDIHHRRIDHLADSVREAYHRGNFKKALEDAAVVYLLGREEMFDYIIKAQQALWRPPLLFHYCFLESESISTVITKKPRPDISLIIDRVLTAGDVYLMLDFKASVQNLTAEMVLKEAKKLLLKIHPDKCNHRQAAQATAKINSELAIFKGNPERYEEIHRPRNCNRSPNVNVNLKTAFGYQTRSEDTWNPTWAHYTWTSNSKTYPSASSSTGEPKYKKPTFFGANDDQEETVRRSKSTGKSFAGK